jgi:signal transduction histidine kinase
MQGAWRREWFWLLAGGLLGLAGTVALALRALGDARDAFETDARIVHRLLSQRVVQHDAILATLTLLHGGGGARDGEQRLPAVYPQILGVQRREGAAVWADTDLQRAEVLSRAKRRPEVARADFAAGHYILVTGTPDVGHALSIDLRTLVPWGEWPMDPSRSPVAVWLEHAGQRFTIQPGRTDAGWQLDFRKHLAAESQPFDVVARRTVGWRELPWLALTAWWLGVGTALGAWRHALRQRSARQRAEELLRLGQVARLNTLGELAAGMAHELNQPLTAVLASTQAARRLLDEAPPPIDTVREAMNQAAGQARRAADVLARLRRAVERPQLGTPLAPLDLAEAVRRALHLLEPECQRRGIAPAVTGPASLRVVGEPVAVDQILHNLLLNALQALNEVPVEERRLRLKWRALGSIAELVIEDSGPGIAAEVLPHLFEPFFTTRDQGLGLGLSLSETLAVSLNGSLSARAAEPRGAAFVLTLPLAGDAT